MDPHNDQKRSEPNRSLKDLSTEELIERLGRNCGQPFVEGKQSLEEYLNEKIDQEERAIADSDGNTSQSDSE